MGSFTVAGFDVDRPIGSGWGGELWAARGRASGQPVVLRRLAVADDVASHDRARRAAARLVDVQHPHLVRLRGVLSVEGAVVLVHDQIDGVALDRLLADHGPLQEAEVVTLAVPLAQALATVHARGLVHGRVSASSVLLSDDGRPMLADAGVAGLIPGGAGVSVPADDVRDLALTCRTALGPAGQRGSLARVLSVATVDDAAHRPSAAELAAAVFATRPAAPIQPIRATDPLRPEVAGHLSGVAHGPHSHRRTRPGSMRRASRPWAGLVVAVGAAVVAAFSGLAWAGADPHTSGSTVAAPRHVLAQGDSAARWRSVLVGLDARRASAFAAASPQRLADVYAGDAPALRRDRAALAELAAAGLHVERLRLRPRSVRVVTASARRVVLDVVDVLEPYDVRTARGALVDARPGRGATSWRVTLVRSSSDWQVYDVVVS
jgi:eukaryotic-like serine/threonine-protein kinase